MSGLLGTRAVITSDFNLLLQIVILFVLIVGFRLGRRKGADSLETHGRIMKIAVVLNAAAILLVMGPSFIKGFDLVLAEASTLGFPLTLVHHLLGAIAEIMGIVSVFKKFGNVRTWMRLTLVVWLVALFLGVTFYIYYYMV